MSDEHLYEPVRARTVRAWQIDLNHVEKAWELFKTLHEEYDVAAEFATDGAGRRALTVIQDPYNAVARHLDWIVCGETVTAVTGAEFTRDYRKAEKK